jgi:dolichol-phosphate mannosyltransferase
MTMPHSRTLVIIPTYNEIDNLADQVGRVLAVCTDVDVLIVDGRSPDGTGDLADTLADHPSVFSLHRQRKSGLGGAYFGRFRWALSRGYDIVVEMDADGSHPASVPPELVAGVRDNVGHRVSLDSGWQCRGLAPLTRVAEPSRKHLRAACSWPPSSGCHGRLPRL